MFGQYDEIKEKEHRLMLDFVTHYYYLKGPEMSNEVRVKALAYCTRLGSQIDTIRKGYWGYIASHLVAPQ